MSQTAEYRTKPSRSPDARREYRTTHHESIKASRDRYRSSTKGHAAEKALWRLNALRSRQDLTAWAKKTHKAAISSSIRRNAPPPEITVQDLIDKFHEQNGKCHVTGVTLRLNGKPRDLFAPSLDRPNPGDKHYKHGNYAIASFGANCMRNVATMQETDEFIKAVRAPRTKRCAPQSKQLALVE